MSRTKDVEELVSNARHKSVNKKRLTKLKGGWTTRYLYDKPLIDYLQEDEQPHFILIARQKTPVFKGGTVPTWSGEKTNSGHVMHMLTDQRWITVIGKKKGDKVWEIPITDVVVEDYSTGISGHSISISAPDIHVEVPISNANQEDEIEAAVEYLREVGDEDNDVDSSDSYDTQGGAELANHEHDDSVTETQLTDSSTDKKRPLRNERQHCSEKLLVAIHNKFSDNKSSNTGKLGTQEVVFRESELNIKITDEENPEGEIIEIPYDTICHYYTEQGHEEWGTASSSSLFGTTYIRVTSKKAWAFLLEDGTHIMFRKEDRLEKEKGTDLSKDLEEIHICGENEEMVQSKIGELKSDSPGFILTHPYYSADGEIRVEGWKEGDSELDADINANAKTKGTSIGVEQGGLSVGRSRSKSSIKGDISGKITDNTYSSPIYAFYVLEERLVIDSKLELELFYDDIDMVSATRNGLVIQVGDTTYRTEIPEQEYLNEAKDYIKNRVSKTVNDKSNSNPASSNKLRELKELYDDGVISEEEFESAKSDILDNF